MSTLTERLGVQTVVWSIRGSDHDDAGRQDNQDFALVVDEGDFTSLIAVDGCTSSQHSKVGAVLTAQLIKSSLKLRVPVLLSLKKRQGRSDWRASFPLKLARLLRADVLNGLREIAYLMTGEDPEAVESFASEHLLCTILAAVIVEDCVVVMGLGDGVFELNGTLTAIEAVRQSMPPYLAYALYRKNEFDTNFQIFAVRDLKNVKSVGVFTDGMLYLLASQGWYSPGGREKVPAWQELGNQQADGRVNIRLQQLAQAYEVPLFEETDGWARIGAVIRPAYLKDDCSGVRAVLRQ